MFTFSATCDAKIDLPCWAFVLEKEGRGQELVRCRVSKVRDGVICECCRVVSLFLWAV